MAPYTMDDSVRRENRRVELAHRLLSHGVRTTIIIRLTGITRDRIATLRRRLGVPSRTRRRGPTFSSVRRFLKEPLNRTEGPRSRLCAQRLICPPWSETSLRCPPPTSRSITANDCARHTKPTGPV